MLQVRKTRPGRTKRTFPTFTQHFSNWSKRNHDDPLLFSGAQLETITPIWRRNRYINRRRYSVTIRLAHVFSYAQLFQQINEYRWQHYITGDVKHVLMVHKLNLQCAVACALCCRGMCSNMLSAYLHPTKIPQYTNNSSLFCCFPPNRHNLQQNKN